MKLHEIVSPSDLKPKITKLTGAQRYDKVNAKNTEKLGMGTNSSTSVNPDDPQTAYKTSHLFSKNDLDAEPYYKYLQLILKSNRMENNPYFPKIYKVKVNQFTHGATPEKDPLHGYDVEMERLVPLNSLTSKELEYLGDKMFYEFDNLVKFMHTTMDRTPRYEKQYYKRNPIVTSSDKLSASIAISLNNIIRRTSLPMTQIKDPLLKQALLFIKSFIIKNERPTTFRGSKVPKHYVPDIKGDNIMVRRSPTGPQLVLVDPIG